MIGPSTNMALSKAENSSSRIASPFGFEMLSPARPEVARIFISYSPLDSAQTYISLAERSHGMSQDPCEQHIRLT